MDPFFEREALWHQTHNQASRTHRACLLSLERSWSIHWTVIRFACRQAYLDLYEFLERENDEGRPVYEQVVVSGNPGVGKSMFLVYYLLRLAFVFVCFQTVHMHGAQCTLHLEVLSYMCLPHRRLSIACHSPALLAQMLAACHVADQHHPESFCISLVPSHFDCVRHNTCFPVEATHACCSPCVQRMLAYRHLHDGHAVLWHARGYYYFTPSQSGAQVQCLTEAAATKVALNTSNVWLSIYQPSRCRTMQYVPDVV